jgi:ribonuclease HI
MDHVLSPFHAELIACLQGIQMAVDLGIGRILVETDAQEVARAIKSADFDLSAVGHLIDEIKSLLCSNFISFECVHISRDCNRAAHKLAALGHLCNDGEEVITNSAPDDVLVIVANDLLVNE